MLGYIVERLAENLIPTTLWTIVGAAFLPSSQPRKWWLKVLGAISALILLGVIYGTIRIQQRGESPLLPDWQFWTFASALAGLGIGALLANAHSTGSDLRNDSNGNSDSALNIGKTDTPSTSYHGNVTYWSPPSKQEEKSINEENQDDGAFYKVAGEELLTGNMDPETWARALVFGKGDEHVAKAQYVSLRLNQLGGKQHPKA
ncbi:hypothetical protein [Novosphingobium sp. PASSN1]|uniref:hypothetical protein n=1 Tax=Novosphingobium sp. PASSN1 TaxID=2015561 RepID=UPI0025CFBF2D|nr:hypothetical protein [Novosphingobium sp. PASSN1]